MTPGVWIKRIAVGLVVGVVATVGVAWCIAAGLLSNSGAAMTPVLFNDAVTGLPFQLGRSRTWGYEYVDVMDGAFLTQPGFLVQTVEHPTDLPRGFAKDDRWMRMRYGWPRLAMEWEPFPATPTASSKTARLSLSVQTPRSGWTLPIVPLADGFMIDTALFGGAYVVLAAGASLARKLLVRRHATPARARPAPGRARAWTKRIVAGVGVGLLVTVLGSWIIAVQFPAYPMNGVVGGYTDPASGVLFHVEERRDFGTHGFAARRYAGSKEPPAVERPAWFPADLTPEQMWACHRYGWPLAAFELEHRAALAAPASPTSSLSTITPLYQPWSLTVSKRVGWWELPLKPLVGGLVPDTLVYAGVYIAVACGAAEIRRRRRVGRCPKCLYSLRGLPAGGACPECGTASEPVST